MSGRAIGSLGLAVLVAALSGCGGVTPVSPPAQPYSAKDPAAGFSARAKPSDFRRPIASYRRHVRERLAVMSGAVASLRSAAAAGDLTGARDAWYRADAAYESIGAAYGAFGDLDQRINGMPAGLEGGTQSSHWTGLQRVEFELWQKHDVPAAARQSEALEANVAKLRRRIPRMTIDPYEYSLRAHEVLEGSLHLQLAGRANQWSDGALNALAANVDGTRVVLASLAPMLQQRGPQQLGQARTALARLDRRVQRLRDRGRSQSWNTIPRYEREQVNGYTAAAAQALSYVPELLDPRPPRQSQNPIAGSS